MSKEKDEKSTHSTETCPACGRYPDRVRGGVEGCSNGHYWRTGEKTYWNAAIKPEATDSDEEHIQVNISMVEARIVREHEKWINFRLYEGVLKRDPYPGEVGMIGSNVYCCISGASRDADGNLTNPPARKFTPRWLKGKHRELEEAKAEPGGWDPGDRLRHIGHGTTGTFVDYTGTGTYCQVKWDGTLPGEVGPYGVKVRDILPLENEATTPSAEAEDTEYQKAEQHLILYGSTFIFVRSDGLVKAIDPRHVTLSAECVADLPPPSEPYGTSDLEGIFEMVKNKGGV